MFFKPNFCCSCGEKIERAEWKLLTSRRFCDVCSVEHKGHDLLLQGGVIASLLVGLFGFGSYLRAPSAATPQVLKVASPRQPRASEIQQPRSAVPDTRPAVPELKPQEIVPSAPAGAATQGQTLTQSTASEQPAYYCGALTKKGKPCSRRVKSKGRCWQHEGQPAAIASQAVPDVY